MNKLAIYCCITGEKDVLSEDINVKGVDAFCFTDNPNLKSEKWKIIQIPRIFNDVRRDSRLPKMLPHLYLKDYNYSLYLDGNIICKVPMQRLVDEWLQDTDIAVFKHHTRNCLFDEADECIRLELDDKDTIERHKMRYEGFPRGKGLYQCGVILRRHTPKIKRLNEMWWSEYCVGCKRDQVSFPYCLEKEGVAINGVDSYAHLHWYFEYFNHLKLSEWSGKL